MRRRALDSLLRDWLAPVASRNPTCRKMREE